jgi:hypothetical protein
VEHVVGGMELVSWNQNGGCKEHAGDIEQLKKHILIACNILAA